MSQNKELLRRRLTFRQRRLLRRAYHSWCDTTMFLNLRFWLNAARIQDYHDIHKGERCFIIGNGPSLNQTDLSLLKREYTFGLNRIYLAFDRLGLSTTYYVSVNDLVLRQCATEIENLSCPKFVSWKNRSLFQRRRDIMFLRNLPIPAFSTDIAYGIWEGSTVTYVAMQIAFFMGFRQVILVGVDHHFDTKGPAHHEVVSEGADLNHFDPDYFGKGFHWNLPDLETAELAYRIARAQFQHADRQILNATAGSKLNVFPKVELVSLFRT